MYLIMIGRKHNLVAKGRLGLGVEIESQDRATCPATTSNFADNIVVISNATSVMF